MLYRVEFAPLARRQVRRLARDVQERVVRRIKELGLKPRAGAKKLAAEENLYRVRAGDYRIVYQLLVHRSLKRFT